MPVSLPGEYSETQQIMFSNLRRRVVIDKEWPLKGTIELPGSSPPSLDPDFKHKWLADSHVRRGAEIAVKRMEVCRCRSCSILKGNRHMDINSDATFHVFYMHDVLGEVSVGIISLDPEKIVFRDWEPKTMLLSNADHTHAIGMAIDDALHQCARDSLNNTELRAALVESTERILKGRIRGSLKIQNIAPSIRATPSHTIIKVGVDLKGGRGVETYHAQRALASGTA